MNEILPSGQVVHLDNLKSPARKQAEQSTQTETPSSASVGQPTQNSNGAPEPEAVPETQAAAEPQAAPKDVHPSVIVSSTEAPQIEAAQADAAEKWQASASESSAFKVNFQSP